jgi:hypothetical protein
MSSFGVATIQAPRSKSRARKWDCGKYGRLTAHEIARVAGITREGVWQRARGGLTGEALCMPKHEGLRVVRKRCSKPVVHIAMKLARAFPAGVPTLAQIRKVHPMCDRNAMRWRQALAEAQA